MSPRARMRAPVPGVMVLDSEGVSKAATDRAMYVRLKVAYDDGHRVMTSAAVLAEIVRGSNRDAGVRRVLARVRVEPVSEAIGQLAGRLIGAARMSSAQAVDAMVAATAIAAQQDEASGRRPSVVIVTSDVPDLTRLVADQGGIAVTHAGRVGRRAPR